MEQVRLVYERHGHLKCSVLHCGHCLSLSRRKETKMLSSLVMERCGGVSECVCFLVLREQRCFLFLHMSVLFVNSDELYQYLMGFSCSWRGSPTSLLYVKEF